jgi:hypothetical protein
MNSEALQRILGQMVIAIEAIGGETASLIASGDPLRIPNKELGAASRAGDIRHEIKLLRGLVDQYLEA